MQDIHQEIDAEERRSYVQSRKVNERDHLKFTSHSDRLKGKESMRALFRSYSTISGYDNAISSQGHIVSSFDQSEYAVKLGISKAHSSATSKSSMVAYL